MENKPSEEKTDDSPEESEVANDVGDKETIVEGGEIILNKDIRIRFNESLPHLDKGRIKAFRAVGSNKVVDNLFALVCDRSLTPRIFDAIKYTKVVNPSLAKLVFSGKILWPPAKEERYCFVYENILGYPLLKESDDRMAFGWKPDLVMDNIAYPIINVLLDMRDKDIVHGEIWPGNMFDGGSQTSEKVRLGECLSAPCSSQLPALYEPIERALADPLGRGMGSCADDLYSFGVSLAVMLRTTDPVEGLSDEEVIERKIEKGSYTTLMGKDRLSGAMLELLRGLLYDDTGQRWTLDDVQAWMDGRRLSPKQSPKRIKATRPIILNEKKYVRPELFAKDMYMKPAEAAKLVENGELEQWIERAIEDKAIKARIEQTTKDIASYERGSSYDERVSTAISIALYPECPVRYRGLSFTPSGFGKMLSSAYSLKEDIQAHIEVLRYPFAMQSVRNRKGVDTKTLITRFDSCRAFIGQTALNAGLERCIYLMDQECHCLSPIIKKYYVRTPEEMMDALEGVCSSSKPDILFDRHIISFLSVKDRKNIDPYLGDLGADEPHRRILGQLRTLATIQKRSRLGNFSAIAHWVSGNLGPVYERFHDHKRVELLKKQVDKLKQNGDLTKIALLFDDPKLYESDIDSFYQAMAEYKRLESEEQLIETKSKSKKGYGNRAGSQVSSVISVILSLIIILMVASSKLF